jgi:hypothetical protein
MLGRILPARTGEEAVRIVRALGAHRYVEGRLALVHALVFDAVRAAGGAPGLDEACRWAAATLADSSIELDSKDPRLLRAATSEELTLALQAFWVPGPQTDLTHEHLLYSAVQLGLELPMHDAFDEAYEEDTHPVLVDAGWELLSLGKLDPERHRGAISAYDEPILFEAARFEEESRIPKLAQLQELPLLGLVELLRAVDADGELVEPFVLWTEGDDTYQDYVLRGVLKAAKLAT